MASEAVTGTQTQTWSTPRLSQILIQPPAWQLELIIHWRFKREDHLGSHWLMQTGHNILFCRVACKSFTSTEQNCFFLPDFHTKKLLAMKGMRKLIFSFCYLPSSWVPCKKIDTILWTVCAATRTLQAVLAHR